jgi:hypothetical protein
VVGVKVSDRIRLERALSPQARRGFMIEPAAPTETLRVAVSLRRPIADPKAIVVAIEARDVEGHLIPADQLSWSRSDRLGLPFVYCPAAARAGLVALLELRVRVPVASARLRLFRWRRSVPALHGVVGSVFYLVPDSSGGSMRTVLGVARPGGASS